MDYILYSTGCPKCEVLKRKLGDKGISYIENNNVDEMLAMGIETVPVLKVDGELLSYTQAIKWINNKTET